PLACLLQLARDLERGVVGRRPKQLDRKPQAHARSLEHAAEIQGGPGLSLVVVFAAGGVARIIGTLDYLDRQCYEHYVGLHHAFGQYADLVGDRFYDRLRDFPLTGYRDQSCYLAEGHDALQFVRRDELASERGLEIDARERRKEVRLTALLGRKAPRTSFDPARRSLHRFGASDHTQLDASRRALHSDVERSVVHDAEADVGMAKRATEFQLRFSQMGELHETSSTVSPAKANSNNGEDGSISCDFQRSSGTPTSSSIASISRKDRKGYRCVRRSSVRCVARKSRLITNCPMTAALFSISFIFFNRSPAKASVSCPLYVKW